MARVSQCVADLAVLAKAAESAEDDWADQYAILDDLVNAVGDDDGEVGAWSKNYRKVRRPYSEYLASLKRGADLILRNMAARMAYSDITVDTRPDLILWVGLRRWMLDIPGNGTLDNAAAINNGDGTVGIPITGHGIEVGKFVTLASTTNYNGDFEVVNVPSADVIDITATYNAETFAGTETWTGLVPVFKSRAVTHGAIDSTGVTTGTGQLVLHTDDWYAYELEAVTEETVTFKVVQARSGGTESGSEVWRFYGQSPARDLLENGGSLANGTMVTSSSANTQAITNANFAQTFVGTDEYKIPGWYIATPSTVTAVTAETTTTFRSYALKFASGGTITLQQTFAGLPANLPAVFWVWYNRQVGIATGNLTLNAGGTSTSVALSAQTGWNCLKLVAWPRQYAGGSSLMKITWDTTSGSLYVAESGIGLCRRVGGRYFAAIAGATDFIDEEVFTQTTTIDDTGINKKWIHRWYGLDGELPHDSSAGTGLFDDAA